MQSQDSTTCRHTMSKTLTLAKTAAVADARNCDVRTKFVRIKEVRANAIVCFEFAIGWPELFVDLMLPQPAFDDFCLHQQVQFLND